MPEAYTALFAWRDGGGRPGSRRSRLLSAVGGLELPAEVAEHEWEMRFSPMRIKRIGPSLIPTEVVVPMSELGAALDDIDRESTCPSSSREWVSPGTSSCSWGSFPTTSGRFGFNMAFGLALSVIKIAMRHGGRAYSTGVYFKRHADEILGAERVKAMQAFKAHVDPRGSMNPGKVWGNGSLTTLMGVAETFEPVIRSVANSFEADLGEDFAGGKHGVPDEIARYAYACAQCGYCVEGCTQFSGRGWESASPAGQMVLPARSPRRSREEITPEWVDKFLLCTTCEKCENVCPLNLPIEPAWGPMRGALIQDQNKMTFPPFEMMAASMRKEGNIWANYRDDRDAWLDDDLRASADRGHDEDRLLRRLHRELRRAGHRAGLGQAAGCRRHRVHVPRHRGELLRHPHAHLRPVGRVGVESASEHREHAGHRVSTPS